jgi:hypothetical protein
VGESKLLEYHSFALFSFGASTAFTVNFVLMMALCVVSAKLKR